ncbi:VOC family protein [Cohnella lubricantis]|uniref:VOC family protein n=1 Tax=Cohnella lubricantis TaxID=2163172 RepID=A0A841T9N4_9BACL|nr:VOC family protein [Cohnella lubricantis]
MIASPFVAVDNNKEELKFYQRVLGGEIVVLRKQGEEVLNAELRLGSTKITFADTQAAQPTAKGDYVKVFLRIEKEEEFRRVYAGLAEGGQITKEAYEAPFNGLLATLTDRNGVAWVLSYYRE